MIYAEASYFGGYHFAHIVAWEEARRLAELRRVALANYRRACPDSRWR